MGSRSEEAVCVTTKPAQVTEHVVLDQPNYMNAIARHTSVMPVT